MAGKANHRARAENHMAKAEEHHKLAKESMAKLKEEANEPEHKLKEKVLVKSRSKKK